MKPYFERDGIAIYHGDCRDVLPNLAEDSIDLVFTDPPYLVGYEGRFGSDWGQIANDDNALWVQPVFDLVFRALKPSGICVSFYGWPHVDVFMQAWRRSGLRPVSHIVWVKNVWGLGFFTRGQHEQGYVLAMPKAKAPEQAISDVIEFRRPHAPVHPNEKPVAALIPVIETFTERGGIVLDPFMGSGSMASAAHQLGRRYVGIELDERYCEIAANRLAQGVLPMAVTA